LAKDKRLYMTFPNDFWMHPKIAPLSTEAKWAFVEMNGYSRMQDLDGRIPAIMAERFWTMDILDELVGSHPDRPVVLRDGDVYVIRDYSQHQQTTADREEMAKKRSESGKLGANKRWNDKPMASAMASAWQTDGKGIAETETETKTSTKNTVQDKPARSVDSEFAEWWQVYPRKQAKVDALKAFKAARKTTSLDDLLKGAREYALLNAGGDKSKVKMPAGWLRSERWDDEDKIAAEGLVPPWQQQDRPILHHMASSPECDRHRGYPMPCAGCARDLDEGREF